MDGFAGDQDACQRDSAPLKIAFATIYDLRDIRRGSGTFYSLAKELEHQGHLLHYVGPFESIGFPLLTRALKRLAVASGRRYRSWQDPFIGRRLGRAVGRRLAPLNFDVLLTNDYTIAAYTKTRKPLVIYTDGVFPLRYAENTNPRLANIFHLSVRFCQHVTRLGLRQASLCFFPAAWVVDEALNYHEIDKGRIGIVPFGANVRAPSMEVVKRRAFKNVTQTKALRLLFVGKDWARKGGDVAVETVAELRRRGINASLDVVGWSPPDHVSHEGVVFHGLIDKSLDSGTTKIHELYCQSDALILPSLGEGFVIAALEAAAYGLPTLAYRSVGVVDAVKDGETGVLVPRGAPASAFADAVEGWFANPGSYDLLSRQARQRFDSTVNWERAASRLVDEIRSRLPSGPDVSAGKTQSICDVGA